MDGRRTGESEQAHIARLNDEIERLRGIINDDRLEGAADEIERLREELKFVDEIRQSALQSLFAAEKEIERLRDALYDIQDMPEDWELDEEMNLLFVIDTHVRIAKEALGDD